MRKFLRVDPYGFAEIRKRLMANELVYGVDAATTETLMELGVVVPRYVTEVELIVQPDRPSMLILEDER